MVHRSSTFRTRRQRVAVGLLLLAFSVTAVTWGLSYLRLAAVEYKFGSAVEPGGANGEAQWWTFRARRLMTTLWRGKVTFGLGEYQSLAPTREELSPWDDYGGWTWTTISPAQVRDPDPTVFWRGPTDFAFLGLGTQQVGSATQGIRVVTVPHWAVVIALGAGLVALLRPGRRRAARAARGECPECGYSLAGVAVGAPCPECGIARGAAATEAAAR